MDFLSDVSSYLDSRSGAVLFSLSILVVLSLFVGLVAAVRLNSFSRPLKKLKDKGSADEMLAGLLRAVEENRTDIHQVSSDLTKLTHRSRSFVQHSAVVRYDAFEDIGGKQSFSLCLLDDLKNGYLLTYLTGRNSARSYVVEIANGEAPRKLSNEEKQSLGAALSSMKATSATAGY
ncbi:MAG: DUF4446 family protein [Candidatus Latescibacterota bacterium]